jgi:hypothetical protein
MSEIVTKGIVGIDGFDLIIAKIGGTWRYRVRDETSRDVLQLLQARANEGWELLALAQLTKPHGRGFRLIGLGL